MNGLNTDYIIELANKSIRVDKRKFDEYRKIKIETGVSKNAEGSARVTIGSTEIIVGIKLAIDVPYPDTPDEGSIIVTAELLPLSSPEFEPGPPGIQATELARIVDRGIRESKAIDFKKLCIKKGEEVWIVFIDVYSINDAGNLIDASALAALAAIKTAKLPGIVKNEFKNKSKVDYETHTGSLPLNKLPVTCTVYEVGNQLLVDPDVEEEKAADARLSVAVLADGTINAMQKGGSKGLSIDKIEKMIDLAIVKANELRKFIP